ncbi:acyltransferase family protein [Nanoarchaeota archaeon]
MAHKRLLFVDNLKISLICLVIIHHIAIAYGAAGDLLFKEGASDGVSPIILSLFTGINQSFFMTLFFMLAAYFTVGSLARKGTFTYVKDRFIRLGIPLVFYILFLSPLARVIVSYATGKPYIYRLAWHTGPLWFVETLLIFSLVYVFFRKEHSIKFPSNSKIFLAILGIALLTFIVRIFSPIGLWIHIFQFAYFVHYIFMFYVGIIAYKNNWFEQITDKIAKFWKIVALTAIICYPLIWGVIIEALGYSMADIFGGWSWPSLVLSLIESVAMFSIIISLLAIYKKRFDKQSWLGRWMSPNFYGAYIFHAVLIYLFVVLLYGVSIPSIVKFLIVSLVVVPLSFTVTWLLRKISFIRRVI